MRNEGLNWTGNWEATSKRGTAKCCSPWEVTFIAAQSPQCWAGEWRTAPLLPARISLFWEKIGFKAGDRAGSSIMSLKDKVGPVQTLGRAWTVYFRSLISRDAHAAGSTLGRGTQCLQSPRAKQPLFPCWCSTEQHSPVPMLNRSCLIWEWDFLSQLLCQHVFHRWSLYPGVL